MTLAMRVIRIGEGGPAFIWAHGWGRSHADLVPLAENSGLAGTHIVLDLPGFGQSSLQPAPWDSADYADFIARWMQQEAIAAPVIWIGHSLGCRIGINLAASHPACVRGLFMIAAPGFRRKRTLRQQIVFTVKRTIARALKALPLPEAWKNAVRNKIGSADYRNAGPLRPSFVKIVNENAATTAPKVGCPAFFAYGENDAETPPEFGERYRHLIAKAQLKILPRYDHYDILTDGRFQITRYLQQFTETL